LRVEVKGESRTRSQGPDFISRSRNKKNGRGRVRVEERRRYWERTIRNIKRELSGGSFGILRVARSGWVSRADNRTGTSAGKRTLNYSMRRKITSKPGGTFKSALKKFSVLGRPGEGNPGRLVKVRKIKSLSTLNYATGLSRKK